MADAATLDAHGGSWSAAASMLYYRFGSYLFLAFLDDPAWIAFWFC